MAECEELHKYDPLVFECPVCMEILIPPIYQCYNGHLLCNRCLPEFKKCPVCRQEMPKQRNRNLVMEEMVRQKEFACPNQHLGCSALMKFPLIDEHRIDCPFTVMNFCQFLGIGPCDKTTKAEDFVEHLKEAHEILWKTVTEGSPMAFCWLGTLPEDLEPRKVLWKVYVIVQGSNTFFLRIKVNTQGISWLISVLGSSDVASKFKAKIKLVSPNKNQDTALSWHGRVCGLRSKFEDNSDVFSASLLQTKVFSCKLDDPEFEGLSFQVSIKKKEAKSLIKHHDLTEVETLVDASFYTEADGRTDLARRSIVNESVSCDGCLAKPFAGPRYTCIECRDYDLCKDCVDKNIHSDHLLVLTKANNMDHKLRLARVYFRASVLGLK